MIISTKIGQTSFVNENGTRVSATVLDYNSCTVVGNRTIDRDGYLANIIGCLLYTSPSPRDAQLSRMPSSA